MKRREFFGLLIGAAVARSTKVFAQQPKPLPAVALVFSIAPPAEMMGPDPISKTELRSAEGMPQLASAIFAELLERGVDVMMLAGERWLHEAALRATRTIPLVATFAEDPIAAGLIKSLARPDGNLTGITLTTGHELTLKRLQLFKEPAPKIGRIAYLATQLAVEQYSVSLRSVQRPSISANLLLRWEVPYVVS
jgi:putative tryptophan/tyrosine transport system substrate-binding protein